MKKYLLCALLATSLYASTEMSLKKELIEVKGRKVTQYVLDGKTNWNAGDTFNLVLANDLGFLTSLHFQGLICPNQADGSPYLTGAPIAPDRTETYSLALQNPGTYFFMGSFGLQQQSLFTAPFIVLDPQDQRQQVSMLLEDFSFKAPEEIWLHLRRHIHDRPPRQNTLTKTILSEVKYDAYLTNKKTLDNPDVIEVQEGSTVRLRIMNASCMSSYFIKTGTLTATVLAVDAQNVLPLQDSLFEIAPGQRIDLELNIPVGTNNYPILAEAQGTNQQTGLILRTPGAPLSVLSSTSKDPEGRWITQRNEFQYTAVNPLPPQIPDRNYVLKIEGNAFNYVWSINGFSWPKTKPLPVRFGERIQITLDNQSQTLQSFSLHGHVCQVVNIGGTEVKGAMRDTFYVLPQESITIQFDAKNPGIWPLASQQLYQRWGGLMTEIMYEGFKPPYFTDQVQEAYYNRYGGRPLSHDELLQVPNF